VLDFAYPEINVGDVTRKSPAIKLRAMIQHSTQRIAEFLQITRHGAVCLAFFCLQRLYFDYTRCFVPAGNLAAAMGSDSCAFVSESNQSTCLDIP
jgi:hypothetical protein